MPLIRMRQVLSHLAVQQLRRGKTSLVWDAMLQREWAIGVRTTAPTAREWQYVASSSDGTKLAAVAAGTAGGIWINASSGAGDWTQRTGGKLPADVAWRSIASDSDGENWRQ